MLCYEYYYHFIVIATAFYECAVMPSLRCGTPDTQGIVSGCLPSS